MRIFLAGVVHEANIFSPVPTTRESFDWQVWDPQRGPKPDDVDSLAYGFALKHARNRGHEVVQSLFCSAQASGAVRRADWDDIVGRVRRDAAAAGPVDAAFLFLHGSELVDGLEDAEADVIAMVQSELGHHVPVGVMLDLHTNMTPAKRDTGALLMGCKEYPHIDYEARTLEMLDILERTVAGSAKPVVTVAQVRMVGAFPTTSPSMKGFLERVLALETGPILSVSPLHGFFGADNPHVGASVVVIADGDRALAEDTALRVARDFADTVEGLPLAGLKIEEALDAAGRARGAPVVMADGADNPGGGAAGDSTFILQAIIDRGMQNVALGMIWDPAAVDAAHAAGIGARLRLQIGGKTSAFSGPPVEAEVEIRDVRCDAHQSLFGVGQLDQPLGRSALVRLEGEIDVVLNSVRQQVFSPHCFTAHGVDLFAKSLVVVKSTQHFEEGFRGLAAVIIRCEAPGTVTSDLTALPYKALRRPLFPMDTGQPIAVSLLA